MTASDQCRCSATLLRKANRRISHLYDAALAPCGLSITQYSVMREIMRRGRMPPTLTELAEAMVMDRSGLGHTLRPLERDGYLALEESPRDRRWRHIALTAKGVAQLRKARRLWKKAEDHFARTYGAKNIETLQASLRAIAHDARLARD